MKYILSCTCPFLNCHLRHDKETGSDLCPAVVSEIVLGDAPVNYWPIFSLSLVKIWEAFAKVNLVQFFPGSYVENRPFLHSCKQRHQLEAWVDKIHWFVWNCPPERQPHFFMLAHWSGMGERSIAIFCYQLLCSAKVWFYFSPTWATLLTDTVLLSLQKSLGTGMGGQSVEDLERVIAAMRRVVERLQGENDQLKKTVGSGGPQYGEVIKENKRLKVI